MAFALPAPTAEIELNCMDAGSTAGDVLSGLAEKSTACTAGIVLSGSVMLNGFKIEALNGAVGEKKFARKLINEVEPAGCTAVFHLTACKAAEAGVGLGGLNVS